MHTMLVRDATAAAGSAGARQEGVQERQSQRNARAPQELATVHGRVSAGRCHVSPKRRGNEAGYLVWKVRLWTISWTRLRRPPPRDLRPRHDRFHHVAIGELDRRAGGVGEQIRRQVSAPPDPRARRSSCLNSSMFLNLRPSASWPDASTGGPRRYSQIPRPRNFPGGESPFSAR